MSKQDWERLAVLGTDKKRFSEQQRKQLTAWGIVSSSSEQALLQALAIVHKQHEAGFKPRVTDGKISPAPPETRYSMNMKSTGVLHKLVGTGNLYLVAELLQRAIHDNQRLSEYLLTDLMALGIEKKMLFPLVQQLLGERGKWLARLNPEWSVYLAHEREEIDWELASKEERRQLIGRLRASAPALAIEWLTRTWPEESAKDKAAYLQLLHQGISETDEPFLLQCLEERSKYVRQEALSLLARIPEGSYSTELKRALVNNLQVKQSARNSRMAFSMSGFTEQLKLKGEQQSREALKRTNPAYWLEATGLEAGELIRLLLNDRELLNNLAAAAVLHRHQAMLSALLLQVTNWQPEALVQVSTAITPHFAQPVLTKLINRGKMEAFTPAQSGFGLLVYGEKLVVPSGGARKLARLIIEALNEMHRDMHLLLEKLPYRFPASQYHQLEDVFVDGRVSHYYYRNAVRQVKEILMLRKEIHDSFTEHGK